MAEDPPKGENPFVSGLKVLIHSPFAPAVVFGIIAAIIIFASTLGLDSKDREDLILKVWTGYTFAGLGWLLFLITVVVFPGLMRWRERSDKGEIKRLNQVINEQRALLNSRNPELGLNDVKTP